MTSPSDTPLRLLRLADVQEKVGLRHTAIYALMGKGEFPRPVKLGPKAARWPEHEIDAWIQGKLAARETHAAE